MITLPTCKTLSSRQLKHKTTTHVDKPGDCLTQRTMYAIVRPQGHKQYRDQTTTNINITE